MIFYFSGTGNSKWIANQLTKELQESSVFLSEALINDKLIYSLREEERIGFVFPIHSWAPPQIVLQFIQQITLENYTNQYLYFVCSCGDDTGLTQQVFEKAVIARGWTCNAGFSLTMPNSYVLFPGFDVDSKKLEKKKLDESVLVLDRIVEIIKKREGLFLCNEGRFPFIKTKIIQPLFTRFQMSPRNFFATDACVKCRRCEKVCPVENISFDSRKPVWGKNCTSCLACYHVCPQQAVQYGNRTKNKGQYFNPNL